MSSEITEKKTYRITVSLINSWLYYINNQSEKNLESFIDSLKGKFTGNKWTKRGTQFESEVVDGKHGKLSEVIMPLKKQVWCEKYIETNDFILRIAGKLDAIDRNNKAIYDIKRVDKFGEYKYSDNYTVQHLVYFYLNPEITDFYYLVVEGEDNEIIGQHIVHKKRPEEKELESSVLNKIIGFINFLKENDLWETYKECREYKSKYEKVFN